MSFDLSAAEIGAITEGGRRAFGHDIEVSAEYLGLRRKIERDDEAPRRAALQH